MFRTGGRPHPTGPTGSTGRPGGRDTGQRGGAEQVLHEEPGPVVGGRDVEDNGGRLVLVHKAGQIEAVPLDVIDVRADDDDPNALEPGPDQLDGVVVRVEHGDDWRPFAHGVTPFAVSSGRSASCSRLATLASSSAGGARFCPGPPVT